MIKERDNPIASSVRKHRNKLGLTQQELAKKSKSTLRFIRQLEQGKTTVRMDKVNQLLYYFGRECSATIISDKKKK